jgi:2-keto-4-pentenoate hydratase
MIKPKTFALLLGCAMSLGAGAQCLSDTEVAALSASIAARTPAATPAKFTDADGACSRGKLNALMAKRYGPVIGYKAGLTNPAVQQRFGADQPVWGVLYEGMVLDSGAVVDAAFGARPLYEADLLVRVKSADINNARTPEDVIAAIDQVIPFIELPDLAVQSVPQLNAAGLAAINVGARFGVKGVPVAVPDSAFGRTFMLDALRDMTIVVTDGKDGKELARGKGGDILEHPLNAVVWLAQALAREGLAMQPGQLISLGSFTPLTPPTAGLTVLASYQGLPDAQPVVASFYEPGSKPQGCAIGPQTDEARAVACYRPFIR